MQKKNALYLTYSLFSLLFIEAAGIFFSAENSKSGFAASIGYTGSTADISFFVFIFLFSGTLFALLYSFRKLTQSD